MSVALYRELLQTGIWMFELFSTTQRVPDIIPYDSMSNKLLRRSRESGHKPHHIKSAADERLLAAWSAVTAQPEASRHPHSQSQEPAGVKDECITVSIAAVWWGQR